MTTKSLAKCTAALALLATLTVAPSAARAFCGFYVSGADGDLFNNATMVVMMRNGTKTALSMQNNYQGPPADFAMIVPVPVVLKEENVKTLPREVFEHVDRLAAPRLVEYWEQDPCFIEPPMDRMVMKSSAEPVMEDSAGSARDLGVTVEAQFDVAEYQIVILSAKDSTGLDTWLKQEGYKIPADSEPLLRPYVEGGSKFFVAKVDVEKVEMKDGQAMLSPLRFHYDSKEFSLPVRLGLVNSAGTQDLIVHVLARGQRYEVANYPNVTIPTNINVDNTVREKFGAFYASLFDSTLEKNKGAVITEYSWDAGSCDPCPTPPLQPSELATLGADALFGNEVPWDFVLTRLHARYGKDSLGEDLVFKEAAPIVGGREFVRGKEGLEKGSQPGGTNNFQGRYAIRHEWTGPIECDKPMRGRWGGPPADINRSTAPRAAMDLAFAPRGEIVLAKVVREDIPELGVKAAPPPAPVTATKQDPGDSPGAKKKKGSGGCGCSAPGAGGSGLAAVVLVGFAVLGRRRRSSPRG